MIDKRVSGKMLVYKQVTLYEFLHDLHTSNINFEFNTDSLHHGQGVSCTFTLDDGYSFDENTSNVLDDIEMPLLHFCQMYSIQSVVTWLDDMSISGVGEGDRLAFSLVEYGGGPNLNGEVDPFLSVMSEIVPELEKRFPFELVSALQVTCDLLIEEKKISKFVFDSKVVVDLIDDDVILNNKQSLFPRIQAELHDFVKNAANYYISEIKDLGIESDRFFAQAENLDICDDMQRNFDTSFSCVTQIPSIDLMEEFNQSRFDITVIRG